MKRRMTLMSVVTSAVFILAACSSGSSDPTPAPTPRPTPTAVPTSTPSQPPHTAAPVDLSRSYTNDIAGFSIGYPADWDLQQAEDVVSFSHSSGAEVSITFEVLGSVTIQEYASLLAAAGGHRQISTTPLHQPPGVLVVGETDIEGMLANVSALIADHFGSAIAIVGLAPRDAGTGVLATVDAIIASASFVTPLSLSVDSHGDEAETATAPAP